LHADIEAYRVNMDSTLGIGASCKLESLRKRIVNAQGIQFYNECQPKPETLVN